MGPNPVICLSCPHAPRKPFFLGDLDLLSPSAYALAGSISNGERTVPNRGGSHAAVQSCLDTGRVAHIACRCGRKIGLLTADPKRHRGGQWRESDREPAPSF